MPLSETDVCSLLVVCRMDIMAFVLRIRYVNEYYAFAVQHSISSWYSEFTLHFFMLYSISFPKYFITHTKSLQFLSKVNFYSVPGTVLQLCRVNHAMD